MVLTEPGKRRSWRPAPSCLEDALGGLRRRAWRKELPAFLIDHTSESSDSSAYWQKLFDEWVYRAPCPTLAAAAYTLTEGMLSFTLSHLGDAPDLEAVPLVVEWSDGSTSDKRCACV